jgi:hypothetical protein
MIRIDARTVELTDVEMIVSDYFERLLDRGYSIPEAVALMKDIASEQPISDEFWAYLSQ